MKLSNLKPSGSSPENTKASSQKAAQLYTITGRARKCGPCAISAITGMKSHIVAAVMRVTLSRTQIHGVTANDIEKTLKELGHKTTRQTYRSSSVQTKPTLKQWIEKNKSNNAFIIALKGHLVAYANKTLSDNSYFYHKKPTHLSELTKPGPKDKPNKLRARVEYVIEITRNDHN